MKNLKNNKDLFDDQELPDGHFERFEALLDKQDREKPKNHKRINFPKWISVAASVTILIVFGVYFYTKGFIPKDITIDNNETEFYVTNQFYKQQMDQQIADIECKLDQVDPSTRQDLMKDIQRISKENEMFIREIASTQDEKTAIYYMVQHYNNNIQALEFINNKLGKYYGC